MISRTKLPGRYYIVHSQDVYTNLGYDYRGHILEKSTSKQIRQNKAVAAMLAMIETLLDHLVDSVKQIGSFYMVSVDRKDRNIN